MTIERAQHSGKILISVFDENNRPGGYKMEF
jgi:hypothetical protein